MTFFRVLLAIDIVAAAALLFFFLWGLADGSAYYAMGLWLIVLAFACGSIFGAVWLHRSGNKLLGTLLLVPLAWPAFFYGLFLLAAITFDMRWN